MQGVTTKAQTYQCNATMAGECDKPTGHYLNPGEACQTYSRFGRMPSLNPDGWNILCTEPGKVTDEFDVSNDLVGKTVMLVDKTVR